MGGQSSKRRGAGFLVRRLRNPKPHRTVLLLRFFGATIGERVTIKGRLYLDNVWQDEHSAGDLSHLTIGNNVYVGDGVYMDLADRINLGDDAVIAGAVRFVTHLDVNRSPFLRQRLPRVCSPVRVERGASVSFGATMLAGSVLGEDAALGANSLLLQDQRVPARTVWVGQPARQVREF